MSKHSRLYTIFVNMKKRCLKAYCKDFKNYGGRGITVCAEWADTENIRVDGKYCSKGWIHFKEWALANGYADNLTLDRIDTNKDYSPNNCRWVSSKVQNNNRRNNFLITYNGVTKTLQQWADDLKIHKNTLRNRLLRGWSVERALIAKLN